MQKRRPAEGGVDLLGGDRLCSTKQSAPRPPIDGLNTYQALRLMQAYAIRPELAATLAALAYGGAA